MFQVLIVDDEESTVEALAVTLPKEELEIEHVYKAYSSEEALRILEMHTVDILITDIQMPEENGLQLIKKVNSQYKGIKCILLTGHAEFEYAKEAIDRNIVDYLLKPIKDHILYASIRKAKEQLKQEWETYRTQTLTRHLLKENIPLLKNNLLMQLIEGRQIAQELLDEKLETLELPMRCGNSCSLMLVRLEDGFEEYETNSLSLFEYAITNMAEEIFADHFWLWMCKDWHGYLIYVIQLRDDSERELRRETADWIGERKALLERLSLQLQKNVGQYLKGEISVVVGNWGHFPDDVAGGYEALIASVRKMIGGESGIYLTIEDGYEGRRMQSLKTLYEPPALIHLLEAGRWSVIEEKLTLIFDELEGSFMDSQEYLQETFYVILSSYSYLAHRNGKLLTELLGTEYEALVKSVDFRFIRVYREWAFHSLQKIRADMESNKKENRYSIVEKIQRFIDARLAEDVSLQAIADHVILHPVYVSKLYKTETGESLSDYLLRIRMEKAAYLLHNTEDKVYEIALQIGYQSAPYFNKVFKDYHGFTPQEFRKGG